MTLDEALEYTTRAARWFKVAHVMSEDTEDTDLYPVVLCFRGSDAVAALTPGAEIAEDVDAALRTARAAVRNFEPDAIGVFYEVVAHHLGGKVEEALTVQIYNQAGDHHLVLMPYRLAGRDLHWGAEMDYGRGDEREPTAAGRIVDAVTTQFTEPSIRTTLAQAGLLPAGIDPDYLLAVQDAVAVRVLPRVMQVDGFLLAEPGSMRERVLREKVSDALISFQF